MVRRGMGLTINQWGPAGWEMLHVFSHSFAQDPNDDDRHRMHSLLHLFAIHLPCPSCRRHFSELLQRELPTPNAPALVSRDALVAFVNDAHNEVNRRLGKRTVRLQEHYRVFSVRPRAHHSWPSACTFVCVAAALAILVAAKYAREKRPLQAFAH